MQVPTDIKHVGGDLGSGVCELVEGAVQVLLLDLHSRL